MNNKIGRPLKFPSVKILQEKIDRYFDDCTQNKEPPTVTGLAVALDTSRKVLLEYEDRKDFSNAIKRAKTKIEAHLENLLLTRDNAAGKIFVLKNNFNWRDKIEVESKQLQNAIDHDPQLNILIENLIIQKISGKKLPESDLLIELDNENKEETK